MSLDGQSALISPPAVDPSLLDAQLNGTKPNGLGHAIENKDSSPTSERLQVINDEKNFTTHLSSQIERWGLRDVGFNYNIVAVFGSQSTGKSTLLNRLFGTTFDVMDETRRQQTTKGIWMCRGNDMSVMVMDVEGTDGRERGEDQDFERKSALFSLASSEVLLINLWEHQVGLYQGANMGLLKTVFEVNLGLFGKKAQDGSQGRTLLLFVIRDHIGVTPLANLQATLTADLTKIWDSLSKPQDLQDRQLSDYFDLAFTALPHKILATDKFEAEVQELRKRFVDKNRDDFVFKPAYHKRIPADGVAFYMDNIWEQVQTNKDLDLPTQQELLAQFRCDEISSVALAEFTEQSKSQRRPIEAGRVVECLGGLMRNWRSQALERYDRDASRYHQGVYKRKRDDLLAVLDSALSPLFLGQLKNLHKSCLSAFKKELLEGLRGEEYNFADVVGKARTKCETQFTDGATEALLEDTDWTWEDELESLREEIGNVADQCRKDETKKMVNLIERNFKKQISEPVEINLNKAAPDMWDNVLSTFKQTLEKAESTYLAKARSFNCTDDENVTSLAALRKRAWLALRAKIDEQTADTVILSKLRSHFEERFRYDDNGVPRVWRPDDDIDGAFKKAKEQTLDLIPRYANIAPTDPSLEFTLPSEISDPLTSTDEFDFSSTLVIFTETKSIDLASRFRKDADAYYVEAKRSTVSSIAQIPYWMYGVLVVLGWNEAMVVLFNPLYFTFTLMAMITSYFIVKLGLTGPLLQVSKTVMTEVQRQATDRLRDHFSQPVLAQPMRASSVEYDEDSDYEMRRRGSEPM
ncbi:root hair defective 3 GTP-binding protein [Rhizopogon vinicolor AM-OR11-026]|uniref:Root hair defective 3 GTP-binding protein n=1 Tax=Rhizopogon vinicolor AM-OR11-026 TaxID=1314800 RepID=A0A1B7N4N5_9AGAM|nr:root hair defective 3 GTP-binding protein [Rhizopogon vinicolor AM-OR11-026]